MTGRGLKRLVGAAVVVFAFVAAGVSQVGGAGFQIEDSFCPKPRFALDMGASEGTWQGETPGVSFAYHNQRKVVVFNVAAGYRAEVTCANSQHGASVTASPEGTVEGPAQISLTSVDDILFVGFTSSVVPPPPQAITPTLDCVSQVGNCAYQPNDDTCGCVDSNDIILSGTGVPDCTKPMAGRTPKACPKDYRRIDACDGECHDETCFGGAGEKCNAYGCTPLTWACVAGICQKI